MRSQELSATHGSGATAQASSRDAGVDILDIYARLAQSRRHLLADVIGASAPETWAHYPANNARDSASGFQWFYHCHGEQDRPGSSEHGHIHLFARQAAWRGVVDFRKERRWRAQIGIPGPRARTRHLLGIGLDAKGVPNSLFTVNQWVTGDAMLSAQATLRLLDRMQLDTGHAEVDALIGALVCLCAPEICRLLCVRDDALMARAHEGTGTLDDPELECLSEIAIDLDRLLERAFR